MAGSGDAADAKVNTVVMIIFASFRVTEPVPTCGASIHARDVRVKNNLRNALCNACEREPLDLVGLRRRERGQRRTRVSRDRDAAGAQDVLERALERMPLDGGAQLLEPCRASRVRAAHDLGDDLREG